MTRGKVWHNNEEIEQFSYTVYFSKAQYVDVRPYVKLPTQRGFTKIPVHILQIQSSIGYAPKMDVCHLNEDKFDNRIENLVYMTRKDHRHHDGCNGMTGHKRPENINPDLSYMKSGEYRKHYKKFEYNKL